MLPIRCPYREAERPELEINHAGEAHIARPADPSKLSDEEWKNHLFIRSNPRGTHQGKGATSTAAGVSSTPSATPSATNS